ncbi:hypothetical protein M404DRAFT_675428 [Pisolithus tinctorius Marx 270]|uniref:Uncharacterized protein n=1 Tax=Pisolithus tinctorius Marx 270 TaxID=870435 RepID=A0A0C3PUD5_PISTI|nr:hypothetical protein M404DRAFT_675428 [Pisolithus tinctorius Marx 270]
MGDTLDVSLGVQMDHCEIVGQCSYSLATCLRRALEAQVHSVRLATQILQRNRFWTV